MSEAKHAVVIVDDSPVVRTLLKHIIDGSADFFVAAQAGDGLEGVELIKKLRPAVVTMDVQMPRMDGPSAIQEIMRECPTPIIVCSVLAFEGAPVVLKSLQCGAFDFVTKPKSVLSDPNQFAQLLIGKLRAALSANRESLAGTDDSSAAAPAPTSARPEPAAKEAPALTPIAAELVAFGASTGGPKTILSVLPHFPEGFPAAIVVALQDVPTPILKLIADQLSKVCKLPVDMATPDRPIERGRILLVSGEHHAMVIRGAERDPILKLIEKNLSTEQSPALNGLFSSVAVACPGKAVGVLLTGTGKDGALGIKKIRQSGGRTIAEDRRTAVVFDKPAAAIALDVVDLVLPSSRIVEGILKLTAYEPADAAATR